MAKRTGAKAEARIPLSRERVLSAAIALADESGIVSLSMRKLAERLGVEAMSLYNHIANKNDLLEGIVEAAEGEIVTPADDVDWKKAIHEVAISAHDALLRHPWASGLWMGTTPGPARMRYGDSLLGAFRGAGFSKDLTYHAYHIVESYVLGFTTQVLNFRSVDESQFEDVVAAFSRGTTPKSSHTSPSTRCSTWSRTTTASTRSSSGSI